MTDLLEKTQEMKPKQLLRLFLTLFILGTGITLATGIFYSSFVPKIPVPHNYSVSSSTGIGYGIPFPWISYFKVVFFYSNYNVAPIHLPASFWGYSTDSWAFNVLNFIEDILLYSSIVFLIPLFDYLIKLIIHWRFGKTAY